MAGRVWGQLFRASAIYHMMVFSMKNEIETAEKSTVCPRCNGRRNVRGRAVDGSNRMPCPDCNGSGVRPGALVDRLDPPKRTPGQLWRRLTP